MTGPVRAAGAEAGVAPGKGSELFFVIFPLYSSIHPTAERLALGSLALGFNCRLGAFSRKYDFYV
jgi:hypothetical protein